MYIYIIGAVLILVIIGLMIGTYFLGRWMFDRIIDFVTYNKLPWSDFVFDHYFAYFHFFRSDGSNPNALKKSIEYVDKFYPKLSEYDAKTIKGIYSTINEILIGWRANPKSEDLRRKFELTMETLKNFIAARKMKHYNEAIFESYKGSFINVREPGEIRDILLGVSNMIADLQDAPIDFPSF